MPTLTIHVQTPENKPTTMSIWSSEENPAIRAQLVSDIEKQLKEKGVITKFPKPFEGHTAQFMWEGKCIASIDMINRDNKASSLRAEDLKDRLDIIPSPTEDASYKFNA